MPGRAPLGDLSGRAGRGGARRCGAGRAAAEGRAAVSPAELGNKLKRTRSFATRAAKRNLGLDVFRSDRNERKDRGALFLSNKPPKILLRASVLALLRHLEVHK